MRRTQKAEATPPRRKLRRETLQWLKDGQQEILERVKARGGSFFTETSSMYFEPPCTERYARWCGRTASQLMTSLLPDRAKYDLVNLSVIYLNDTIVMDIINEIIRKNITLWRAGRPHPQV